MVPSLQDEETPIDQEIVNELIALTPEWWNSAVLEVHYFNDGGIERYSHVISSPEGHKEIVDPSEGLFDATHRLGLLFRRRGRQWKRVTYLTEIHDDESWNYKVDFEY